MARDFMIDPSGVYAHSLPHDGQFDWLEPHPDGFDFEADGRTAEPGATCPARGLTWRDRCRRPAMVVLVMRTNDPKHFGRLHLCASHWSRHRRGLRVKFDL